MLKFKRLISLFDIISYHEKLICNQNSKLTLYWHRNLQGMSSVIIMKVSHPIMVDY